MLGSNIGICIGGLLEMVNNGSQRFAGANRHTWNDRRYQSWFDAFGSTDAAAAKLRDHLLPHLGRIKGQRIFHVQGSQGRIAVALSVLGADVAVVDFAPENKHYADALAAAAGVSITYEVCDVHACRARGVCSRVF